MGFSSGILNTENVDLDSSQTVSNKTLDASNDYSGDIIDPSRSDVKQGTQAELEAYAVGASNGQMCFATDTKQMYQVLDGALAAVGGGSGGLDVFHTDTFEVAGVSDYTSGNDATFDNGGSLAGSLADETVNNISGDQSFKYTQAAGSLNDFVKSPLIPIDKKQQGNTVGLELFYTYSGNSDDLKIVGYDDTGSEVMTLSSNLIKASSKAQRLSVQFPVPSGSANLAWGIQVVVENIGAVLVVDDVQISTNPYVSKDLLETQEYSISQAGSAVTNGSGEVEYNLGTATIDNVDNALIFAEDDSGNTRTKFIANRRCTVHAQYESTLTALGNRVYITKNGVIRQYGAYTTLNDYSSSVATSFDLESGEYFTVGSSGIATIGGNEVLMTFTATATTNHIVAYNSRNAENSMIRLAASNGHGSTNTMIRRFSNLIEDSGNAITYADSATDGASFTVNEDGVYMVSYSDNSSTGTWVGLSINSSQLTTAIQSITESDRLAAGYNQIGTGNVSVAWSGNLAKGDIIRPHKDGISGGNASNASFTISKIGVGDLLGTPIERIAYVKDVKASGTAGGTFTSGAWQTRDLNTLEGDTEFISLNANQVTLSSGKYIIEAYAPAMQVNGHVIKIRDITNSIDINIGTPVYAASSGASNLSQVISDLEITSNITLEVQHRCNTTKATNGLGNPLNFGVDEVYTQVKITRIS